MKERFEKIRAAIRRAWYKFRKWFVSILVAIGLVTGGVALAQIKNFSWTNPTQNTDGSVFDPATEQAEVRIYCDVDPASFVAERPGVPQVLSPTVTVLGNATAASSNFMPGTYSCFGTVVSIYGYESDPSNVTTFTITPTVAPNAINDFAVD